MKLLPILMGLFCSCWIPAMAQSDKDSTAIVNLINDDYVALGKSDYARHIANCTPEYMLIENGDLWSLQKEVDDMKSKVNSGMTRTDKFDFRLVRTEGVNGYAVYDLKSSVIRNGQTKNYHWVESAVFTKKSGAWKIQLIHSTRVDD